MARAHSPLVLVVVVVVALAFAAFALASAGCGTSDDREQAQATVERLYDAIRHDDGDAACRELSTATALKLADEESSSCAAAITDLKLDGGAVVDSRVAITNAKVDLRSGESTFLGREPTGWKVTALGCRPQGEPTDRPMDCEADS
jgi:hypothetical protein